LVTALPETILLPVVLYALCNPSGNIVVIVDLALNVPYLLPPPFIVKFKKIQKAHVITPSNQTHYTITR